MTDFDNPYDAGLQQIALDSLYLAPENRLLQSGSLPAVTLVLGGVRSGKSRFAERMIPKDRNPIYLATAEAMDDEMRARIAQHQARRGENWSLREEPLELPKALLQLDSHRQPMLIDSLGMWLNNLIYRERDVAAAVDELTESLMRINGPVVLVSDEVGLGIVPDNALSRGYRDQIGLLNQRVALVAQQVVFVAAGLPLILKGIQK